jgi:hypothetical protein
VGDLTIRGTTRRRTVERGGRETIQMLGSESSTRCAIAAPYASGT